MEIINKYITADIYNTSNNINSKLKLTGKNNNIYSLRSYILLFFWTSAPSRLAALRCAEVA